MTPVIAWEILRGVGCWEEWKEHNSHYRENQKWAKEVVVGKIWSRYKMYLKINWKDCQEDIKNGLLMKLL